MDKKKKIINIVGLLIALLIIIVINNLPAKELNNEDKEILIESVYSNYAWGYSFRVNLVFTDGTIYSWKDHGDKNNSKVIKNLESVVLKEGKKSIKRVSKKDIETIKKYSKNIKEPTNKKCLGADQGSYQTYVFKDKKSYLLKEQGDCESSSSSIGAKKILSIIKKYHIEV